MCVPVQTFGIGRACEAPPIVTTILGGAKILFRAGLENLPVDEAGGMPVILARLVAGRCSWT
jgi:hypothetical protein